MKLVPCLIAAATTLAAGAAFAQVSGGAGGLNNSASFLALSSASGGGNVSGGAIYNDAQDLPAVAARPANAAPAIATVGNWIAAGPSNTNNGGGDATLTLRGGTTYVSFLWGSSDDYNALTVHTDAGSSSFTAGMLGIPPATGNQAQAYYVNFAPTGAATAITSLVFSSPNANAFEISNVTAVPEPASGVLWVAGLAGLSFVLRRGKALVAA